MGYRIKRNFMNLMLIGAIATTCFMSSVFFLRFWRRTKDRFFLFFAVSFFLEGANRILLGATHNDEQEPFIYLIRLAAFLIILFAIIDKNRKNSKT
jgi:hypothetical protein